MLESLTFITGNLSKAEQLGRHLKYPVNHTKLDLNEIQSTDLETVVSHKATEAYRILGKPVLVEDTSLIFTALGKLPGPFIKWFLESLGNDGLCNLLNGFIDRSAKAEVMFGLHTGKRVVVFDAQIHGTIAPSPKGEKGFGWDPIFIPQGYKKTWGEMNMEEQDNTSMRKIALAKLESYLKNL